MDTIQDKKSSIDENTRHSETTADKKYVSAQYLAEATHYIKMGDPNMELLKEYLVRAKGPSKSMRQFAKDVDVSPATLSRIMTGKAKESLSHELISKIAANADPQSQITLDMLMKANGEEEDPRMQTRRIHRSFEKAARTAIIDSLIKRGYFVKEISNEGELLIRRGAGYGIRLDFAIETNALDPEREKINTWIFEFKSSTSPLHRTRSYYLQWIATIMGICYCGNGCAKRISLVVNDPKIFDLVKEDLEEVCIPDEISVILIDDGEVKKEYVAPTKGTTPADVFYDMQNEEKISTNDDQDNLNELEWDKDVLLDADDEEK